MHQLSCCSDLTIFEQALLDCLQDLPAHVELKLTAEVRALHLSMPFESAFLNRQVG